MKEYAIASEYRVFYEWRNESIAKRVNVRYLSGPERCIGKESGKLHRLGGWEKSQALPEALALEVTS